MTGTKVDLVDDYRPDTWRPSGVAAPLIVRRSLPFVTSLRRTATLTHRVRSARIYPGGSLAVTAWCGQGFTVAPGRAELGAEPHPGYPVCATCEGRAVGAGQITSDVIVGHPVVFTPRPAGERRNCQWERRPYGYNAGGSCWSPARFTATNGTATLVVCRAHHRCAVTRGWDVRPLPGTVTAVGVTS